MQRYGIDFPETRFYELAGVPTDRIISMLAAEQNITLDVQRAAIEKEDAFLELLHLLKPIDLILEVAAHYRGQVPMAVASGGFRQVIIRQLETIGCLDWFDTLVCAEDTSGTSRSPTSSWKPHGAWAYRRSIVSSMKMPTWDWKPPAPLACFGSMFASIYKISSVRNLAAPDIQAAMAIRRTRRPCRLRARP